MSKRGLLETIEHWFYSDFDIEFALRDKTTNEKALCILESDAWYEHINDPVRGVTVKSIRHNGDRRRFIVVKCSDYLYERLKQYCGVEYSKEETLDLIDELAHQYYILNP